MRLTLFMTRGMSLRRWDEGGIFERELALYRRLQAHGIEVGIVTYGTSDERQYVSRIPGMRILCNRWGLPEHWYERVLPVVHGPWLRGSHVLKTNQIDGALVAMRSAQVWRKPLIARCGYMWSEFRRRGEGKDSSGARQAAAVEARVFSAARRVVVTTRSMADDVAERIEAVASRIVVIPNFVDTDLFCPSPKMEKETDTLYVGRLAAQKNIDGLCQAFLSGDFSLTVVGDGPERERVTEAHFRMPQRLNWFDHLANTDLPEKMAKARLFVLPSHYEGHPKSLIEAMAAGMAVIGADSPGIREMVVHGRTGWLCGTDADSLSEAIRLLLAQPGLCEDLGRNARQYALEAFSLNYVVEAEISLLRHVAGRHPSDSVEREAHLP